LTTDLSIEEVSNSIFMVCIYVITDSKTDTTIAIYSESARRLYENFKHPHPVTRTLPHRHHCTRAGLRHSPHSYSNQTTIASRR
jgi:hypothetical protein